MDAFHAGSFIGNPLQDFMIGTDNYFCSFIAPDVITVFFFFICGRLNLSKCFLIASSPP